MQVKIKNAPASTVVEGKPERSVYIGFEFEPDKRINATSTQTTVLTQMSCSPLHSTENQKAPCTHAFFADNARIMH